jgi:hypothetical protein
VTLWTLFGLTKGKNSRRVNINVQRCPRTSFGLRPVSAVTAAFLPAKEDGEKKNQKARRASSRSCELGVSDNRNVRSLPTARHVRPIAQAKIQCPHLQLFTSRALANRQGNKTNANTTAIHRRSNLRTMNYGQKD